MKSLFFSVEAIMPYLQVDVSQEVIGLYLLVAIASGNVVPVPRRAYDGTQDYHIAPPPKRYVSIVDEGPDDMEVTFVIPAAKRFLYYFDSGGQPANSAGADVHSISLYFEAGPHMLRCCMVEQDWVPSTTIWPQYSNTISKVSSVVFPRAGPT